MFINTRAAAMFGALPPNSVPVENVTPTKFQTVASVSLGSFLLIGAVLVEIFKHI